MDTKVGVIEAIVEIQAPKRRENQTEEQFKLEEQKFKNEQAEGYKRKAWFTVEDALEVKGGKSVRQVIAHAVKIKDPTLKEGDRILVSGRPYDVGNEKGFIKGAKIEVLSSAPAVGAKK